MADYLSFMVTTRNLETDDPTAVRAVLARFGVGVDSGDGSTTTRERPAPSGWEATTPRIRATRRSPTPIWRATSTRWRMGTWRTTSRPT